MAKATAHADKLAAAIERARIEVDATWSLTQRLQNLAYDAETDYLLAKDRLRTLRERADSLLSHCEMVMVHKGHTFERYRVVFVRRMSCGDILVRRVGEEDTIRFKLDRRDRVYREVMHPKSIGTHGLRGFGELRNMHDDFMPKRGR